MIFPAASIRGSLTPQASLNGTVTAAKVVKVGGGAMADDDILESLIVSGVLAAVTVDGMLLGDEQGNILMM